METHQKVLVLTGASRGIGQAIAELFAAEGAKVVCAARTLHDGDHPLEGSLTATIAAIKAAGGEAMAVAADVSTEADCIRLIETARAAYGPIDILINNAAANAYVPTKDYPTNRWVRNFAVNVHAPYILSKAVLPDMIAKGVMMTSGARSMPRSWSTTTFSISAAGTRLTGQPSAPRFKTDWLM